MRRAWITAAIVGLLAAAPASAQTREWPTERVPRPLPARDVTFPPYQVQTLENGLRVVVVQHHEQPVVSARLIVRAGSASDPKDKLGLATLAAALLDQGAGGKSAQDIADAIDFIGGALGTGAGTDLTYLNVVVMKDSFEQGLSMLSDVVRTPAFAPAEIDRQRSQMLSAMRVSLEDPDYVANSVFDRLVYGFHPYGLPGNGTPETVQAISRDDLVAFHKRLFAPNNAIMAIVGDTTPDEAFAMAKKIFAGWSRRDVAPSAFAEPPDPTRRVIVVDKPDAVQTEVRVGHLGITRSSKDYMAVNLAIRILGGEGSNRLHQVLRTERGLTYGAQASMDALKESGDFEAQTNTRTEATVEVLRLIVDEFWRLQRERVSERELNDAKAYMTGSFPLTIETPEAIAQQVLNTLFYDLPVEELQNYRDRVNAVTPDNVQRVAKAYLRPDRLSVVLVGNAARFTSQLKAIGFNMFETVSLGDLDLTSATFRRDHPTHLGGGGVVGAMTGSQGPGPAYQPASQQAPASRPVVPPAKPTPASAEDGARAKALIARAVIAKGGIERLKGVKTLVVRDKEHLTAPDGTAKQVETATWVEYPDHVRVETVVPGATLVQGFNGDTGWAEDPRGTHIVSAPVVEQVKASLARDPITLLLAAAEGRSKIRLLAPSRDTADRLLQAIEVETGPGEPTIVYFDADARLVKLTYIGAGPDRPVIEERFDDFRQVEGVQVAYSVRVFRGGQPLLERQLTQVDVNSKIPLRMFIPQRPPR